MWNVIVDFLYLEIARIVFEINIEKKRNDEEKMREIWTVSSAGWLWFECRERERWGKKWKMPRRETILTVAPRNVFGVIFLLTFSFFLRRGYSFYGA